MYSNLLLLFCALLTHCYAHSRVPVLLIDYQGVYRDTPLKTNPFHEVSTGYFTDILYDIIEKSDTIVVFAEENLSPEDVSSQDDQGSPYANLQSRIAQDKVIFLPAVYKPYRVLTQNLQLSPSNYVNVTDANSAPAEIFSRKFFYVFFKDEPGLTRTDAIRRHDEAMDQILKYVRNYKTANVVAIYTGIHNPAEDIEEEVPAIRRTTKDEHSLTVQSQNTMLRFTGLSFKTAMRQSLDYHAPLYAEEFFWGDTLKTRVTSQDFVLEFYFILGKDTWFLDRVTMLEDGEEVGVTRMDVRVPWKRSFVCANPLIVVNNRDGSAIVIPQYQIEPFNHPRPPRENSKRHLEDDNKVEILQGRLRHAPLAAPSAETSTGKLITRRQQASKMTKYRFAQFPPSQWTSSILFRVEDPTNASAIDLSLNLSTLPLPIGRADGSPNETDTKATSANTSPAAPAPRGEEAQQIQKFFSDAVVCCPFFTPGILMAAFVVFVSGSIMLIGIYVLMSCCNSNDRFDQPQMLSLFDLPANKSA